MQKANKVLDLVQAEKAATLVEKVVLNNHRDLDCAEVRTFARALDELVGKTLDQFLKLDEEILAKLQDAASGIARKYRKLDVLYAFLRSIIGRLRRAPDLGELAGRTAVFLVALVWPDRATEARQMYMGG